MNGIQRRLSIRNSGSACNMLTNDLHRWSPPCPTSARLFLMKSTAN